MKNNFIVFFFLIVIWNFCAFSESYIFETKNIEISENGKQIITGKGTAISTEKGFRITANNFDYKKETGILNSNGDGLFEILKENIEIEFIEAKFDEKNSQVTLNGNINFYDKEKNLILETQKILYDSNLNTIISYTKFKMKDNFDNYYEGDNFKYELDKDLLKINSLLFVDKYKNDFKTEIAFINTKNKKLIAKDIRINLNEINNNSQPRIKGNGLIIDSERSEITKGIFTNCKITDDCPPWMMSAKKITHNKKKKTIYYNDAVLRIYNLPVMYFPKFFHPDPTVKRRSGFLMPSIKTSSNSSNFLNMPFFWAVSDNKDMTISPRFYLNKSILFQTDYRQVNKNSSHIADISFYEKNSQNFRSHLFYSLVKNTKILDFKNGQINLDIQKSSNDTYLKSNNIKSEIFFNENNLINSLNVDLSKEDLSIDFTAAVFEDLTKAESDKYEYIIPNMKISKKINNRTNLNGDFFYNFSALARQYDTNITEKININDLIFASYPTITNKGFYNNYEFLLKNSNTNGSNSIRLKDNNDYNLDGIIQLNSSFPLKKENKIYQKIIKPKLSFKLSPNYTKDNTSKDVKIDVDNIFSLNRATYNDTIEGGASLAIGNEYSIIKKSNSSELFNLAVANNIRIEDNNKLSRNNQLNQKTSNFFSKASFQPNKVLNVEYNSAIKNNLKEIDYENIISKIILNNFETKFEYFNENQVNDNTSYISNTSTLKFSEFNLLKFSTRKNKSLDLTEYYNLMYEYKNDCLSASIEYDKNFYSDRDLKPTENIFLKLSIIPYGDVSSPALSR